MILVLRMENNKYINRSRWAQLFIIAVVIIAFNSCRKNSPLLDCFTATGSDITQVRQSGRFDKIRVYNNVNLVLSQSEENTVEIRCGDKIIDNVRTSIDETGWLTIENTNRCNWVRSFEREIIAYVGVKNLHEIEYRSSGDISSENTITSDSLMLNVWEGAGQVNIDIDVHKNFIYFHIGTADVYYTGNVHLSYISATSFGPVDVRNLTSTYTYINSDGSNNCYVGPCSFLNATINSIGNIYYIGDPEINLDDRGDGELIKLY